MKYIYAIILIAAAFLLNDSAKAQSVEAGDIEEIVLKTGDGFCFDCERTTTLRADGSVTYRGDRNSRLRRGDFSGRIGKTAFARLASKFVKTGFFDLKSRYEGKTSDAATIEITVVRSNGQSKTVENFGRSDEPKLKILEQAFDAVIAKIAWRE